jgi:putative transposase
VLESYITTMHDKGAVEKALARHGSPEAITAASLRGPGAAEDELACGEKRATDRWANKRVENSLVPFRPRQRAMLRFGQMTDAARVHPANRPVP